MTKESRPAPELRIALRTSRLRLVMACIIVLAGTASTILPAHSDEPQEITFDLPGLVEDTSPADFHSIELQTGGGYALFRDHRGTSWPLMGEVKYGAAPGLEISLGTDYTLGTTGTANGGTGEVGALYQFAKPDRRHPGFTIDTGYQTSYGVGREMGQTTVRAVATQWLGASPHAPRFDLNVSWYHLTNAGSDNRPDRYDIGAALTAELRPDTALVTELYHAQRQQRGEAETIADIGLLHLLGSHWEIAASVGAGLGRYSPLVQVLVGVQHSLKLF